MRFAQACSTALFLAAAVQGADKKLPIEQTSNELVSISANAFTDKDQVRQEVGADLGDLGADMVIVRVTIHPVSEKPIQVSLDDFLLVDTKDFQRAQPFAPGQLAGSTTLVVTQQASKSGGSGNGVSFGGFGIGGGAGGGAKIPGDSKVETKKSDTENPLLAVLTAKCLPQKETSQEVSGLLYFQMPGKKIKPKDLELHYKGAAGRLALRFHP